ncbi:hypothetical protein ALC62_10159 [Cyphomyrmex costatus]|uniref:Uncharacterized protein n=1 Tax=Cyphomyrmex costatus TaxID=456900 RepID=A0A195CER3_9HYME|nr:hypothetical protein ALC62_10159 [Cyphomyrmex costatus]
MRLNDAQYFRLPLPHTRKQMMVIRVMPRIVDTNYSYVIQDSITSPNTGRETTSRRRGKTLEAKRSSVEIALLTCNSFEGIDQNKEGRQDICIETEPIEVSNNPSFLTWQKDSLSMIANNSEKFAEFPQVEDDRRETIWNSQELRNQVERNCKSVDRKQNCGDRVVELQEEKKRNSWWKDGGQTILQFFAKILGKRGGIGAKGATGYVLPTGKQLGKRVKRVSRGGKGHNGCGRDVDGGIRLKRVNNGYIGYIANHCCIIPIVSTSFFIGSARYSSEFCSIADTRSSTNGTSSLTLISPIDVSKRNDVFRARGSQFVATKRGMYRISYGPCPKYRGYSVLNRVFEYHVKWRIRKLL